MYNILLIGNGFDRAHNLPTSYLSYANYTETFWNLYRNVEIMNSSGLINVAKDKYKDLDMFLFEFEEQRDEFARLLKNNIWSDYFQNEYKRLSIGECWYDLENLIRKEVNNPYSDIVENHDRAVLDLNRFRRAFEIYIYYFIILARLRQPQSLNWPAVKRHVTDIKPQYIINYNYSDTFTALYDSSIEVDYVHGRARANGNIESCNIVFGINEIQLEGRKETYKEFTKKWQMNTYSIRPKYMKWFEKDSFNLHIYGHSLDETDRDSLSEILTFDTINEIHIWTLNEKDWQNKNIAIKKILGEKSHLIKNKIIFEKI